MNWIKSKRWDSKDDWSINVVEWMTSTRVGLLVLALIMPSLALAWCLCRAFENED